MKRLAFALVLLAGCPDDGPPAETDGAPPPPPATTDPGTTTGLPGTSSSSSTGSVPAEVCCEGEAGELSCSPCSDDSQFCSARREFGVEPVGDDYVCRDECVPSETAAFICVDDSSCCDAEATCMPSGFCRLPSEGTTGGSSSGTDGTSSSTGEASSSSSSSSSGGESSSSSSSSSSSGGGDMG